MKFGKRTSCNAYGASGETFIEYIIVYSNNEKDWLGHIFFTASGKPRFVDGESNFDYTSGDLRAILERMEA